MIFSFNRKSAVFFLTLFISAQASAITVYDVIQLSEKAYSDDDIITLITATNSAFELKADDVAHLVELGISEPVIQSMLKASPPTKTEPVANANPAQPVAKKKTYRHNHATLNNLATKPSELQIIWSDIHSEPFNESASGEHEHQAIVFSNIHLFVLRNKGRGITLNKRAEMVAKQLLNVSNLNGTFGTSHNGIYDTIIFTDSENLKDITILEVTPGDAKSYQDRSHNKVTPELLAAYWNSLLTDYWSLAFDNQAPQELINLDEGKALQALYKGMDSSIKDSAERVAQSFLHLSKQNQKRLMQLATTVPDKFTTRH